jgi:maltodextrin utilization protein YvdJ
MIRTVTLDRNQKPTKEQIKQIEEASKREIIFDEDSPKLTPAMEKAFRLAAKNRNTQRKTNIS